MYLASPIPCDALRRLEFLLGGFDGMMMVYPPEQPSIRFESHWESSWEVSERYIRIDLFSRASTSVYDTLLALISYDREQDEYRMWCFLRSQAEPMYLTGNFVDGSLMLVSQPSPMVWGVQKLRYAFTPFDEDEFEIHAESWTLDGWQRYCTSRMTRQG